MLTLDLSADIANDALRLVMLVVIVLVMPGLVTGLLVSMFQAATQINEQTMSFLPRLLVTLVTMGMAGPWIADRLMHYCVDIFQRAAQIAA